MSLQTRSSQSGSGAAPSEMLYGRIRDSVLATPASTVRTSTKVVLALLAAPLVVASVLLIAAAIVYDGQVVGLDVAPQSAPLLMTVLSLLVGLTLVSSSVVLSRGGSGLGPGVLSLGLVAALVAPLYALLVLESPVHAHDSGELLVEISPWGLRCVAIAASVGGLVLVSFAAALRRAVPAASWLRGAAVGAAAGSWAGLTVFLFCPSSDFLHLLVGHVLPVVVFTIVGAVLLPRALRP